MVWKRLWFLIRSKKCACACARLSILDFLPETMSSDCQPIASRVELCQCGASCRQIKVFCLLNNQFWLFHITENSEWACDMLSHRLSVISFSGPIAKLVCTQKRESKRTRAHAHMIASKQNHQHSALWALFSLLHASHSALCYNFKHKTKINRSKYLLHTTSAYQQLQHHSNHKTTFQEIGILSRTCSAYNIYVRWI